MRQSRANKAKGQNRWGACPFRSGCPFCGSDWWVELRAKVSTWEDAERIALGLPDDAITTGAAFYPQFNRHWWDPGWGTPPADVQLINGNIAKTGGWELATLLPAQDLPTVLTWVEANHPHRVPLIYLIPAIVTGRFPFWYQQTIASLRSQKNVAQAFGSNGISKLHESTSECE